MSMVLPTIQQLIDSGIDGTKPPISVRDTAEFRVQCGIYHALTLLVGGSAGSKPVNAGYSPQTAKDKANEQASPPPPPDSPPGQGAPKTQGAPTVIEPSLTIDDHPDVVKPTVTWDKPPINEKPVPKPDPQIGKKPWGSVAKKKK